VAALTPCCFFGFLTAQQPTLTRPRHTRFLFLLFSVLQGVATMRKGELAVFTIAPHKAYGEAGSGAKIPPNSTLKFEIELLCVAPSLQSNTVPILPSLLHLALTCLAATPSLQSNTVPFCPSSLRLALTCLSAHHSHAFRCFLDVLWSAHCASIRKELALTLTLIFTCLRAHVLGHKVVERRSQEGRLQGQ
jgi:hypothetical protein